MGDGGNLNLILPTQVKVGKHLNDRFSVYGIVNPFTVSYKAIEDSGDFLGFSFALGGGFLLRLSTQWSFFTEIQFQHDYVNFNYQHIKNTSFIHKPTQIKALVGFQLGRK